MPKYSQDRIDAAIAVLNQRFVEQPRINPERRVSTSAFGARGKNPRPFSTGGSSRSQSDQYAKLVAKYKLEREQKEPNKPWYARATESFWGGAALNALSLIDLPRAAIVSTLSETTDFLQGEGFDWDEGWAKTFDHYGVGDWLEDEGLLRANGGKNFWARTVGLAGDIVFDPITWLTAGGARASVMGGRGLAERAMSYADDAARGLTDIADDAARKIAEGEVRRLRDIGHKAIQGGRWAPTKDEYNFLSEMGQRLGRARPDEFTGGLRFTVGRHMPKSIRGGKPLVDVPLLPHDFARRTWGQVGRNVLPAIGRSKGLARSGKGLNALGDLAAALDGDRATAKALFRRGATVDDTVTGWNLLGVTRNARGAGQALDADITNSYLRLEQAARAAARDSGVSFDEIGQRLSRAMAGDPEQIRWAESVLVNPRAREGTLATKLRVNATDAGQMNLMRLARDTAEEMRQAANRHAGVEFLEKIDDWAPTRYSEDMRSWIAANGDELNAASGRARFAPSGPEIDRLKAGDSYLGEKLLSPEEAARKYAALGQPHPTGSSHWTVQDQISAIHERYMRMNDKDALVSMFSDNLWEAMPHYMRQLTDRVQWQRAMSELERRGMVEGLQLGGTKSIAAVAADGRMYRINPKAPDQVTVPSYRTTKKGKVKEVGTRQSRVMGELGPGPAEAPYAPDFQLLPGQTLGPPRPLEVSERATQLSVRQQQAIQAMVDADLLEQAARENPEVRALRRKAEIWRQKSTLSRKKRLKALRHQRKADKALKNLGRQRAAGLRGRLGEVEKAKAAAAREINEYFGEIDRTIEELVQLNDEIVAWRSANPNVVVDAAQAKKVARAQELAWELEAHAAFAPDWATANPLKSLDRQKTLQAALDRHQRMLQQVRGRQLPDYMEIKQVWDELLAARAQHASAKQSLETIKAHPAFGATETRFTEAGGLAPPTDEFVAAQKQLADAEALLEKAEVRAERLRQWHNAPNEDVPENLRDVYYVRGPKKGQVKVDNLEARMAWRRANQRNRDIGQIYDDFYNEFEERIADHVELERILDEEREWVDQVTWWRDNEVISDDEWNVLVREPHLRNMKAQFTDPNADITSISRGARAAVASYQRAERFQVVAAGLRDGNVSISEAVDMLLERGSPLLDDDQLWMLVQDAHALERINPMLKARDARGRFQHKLTVEEAQELYESLNRRGGAWHRQLTKKQLENGIDDVKLRRDLADFLDEKAKVWTEKPPRRGPRNRQELGQWLDELTIRDSVRLSMHELWERSRKGAVHAQEKIDALRRGRLAMEDSWFLNMQREGHGVGQWSAASGGEWVPMDETAAQYAKLANLRRWLEQTHTAVADAGLPVQPVEYYQKYIQLIGDAMEMRHHMEVVLEDPARAFGTGHINQSYPAPIDRMIDFEAFGEEVIEFTPKEIKQARKQARYRDLTDDEIVAELNRNRTPFMEREMTVSSGLADRLRQVDAKGGIEARYELLNEFIRRRLTQIREDLATNWENPAGAVAAIDELVQGEYVRAAYRAPQFDQAKNTLMGRQGALWHHQPPPNGRTAFSDLLGPAWGEAPARGATRAVSEEVSTAGALADPQIAAFRRAAGINEVEALQADAVSTIYRGDPEALDRLIPPEIRAARAKLGLDTPTREIPNQASATLAVTHPAVYRGGDLPVMYDALDEAIKADIVQLGRLGRTEAERAAWRQVAETREIIGLRRAVEEAFAPLGRSGDDVVNGLLDSATLPYNVRKRIAEHFRARHIMNGNDGIAMFDGETWRVVPFDQGGAVAMVDGNADAVFDIHGLREAAQRAAYEGERQLMNVTDELGYSLNGLRGKIPDVQQRMKDLDARAAQLRQQLDEVADQQRWAATKAERSRATIEIHERRARYYLEQAEEASRKADEIEQAILSGAMPDPRMDTTLSGVYAASGKEVPHPRERFDDLSDVAKLEADAAEVEATLAAKGADEKFTVELFNKRLKELDGEQLQLHINNGMDRLGNRDGQIPSWFLDEGVLGDINKVRDPKFNYRVFKAFGAFTNWWKAMAIMTPGFHLRNLFGGFYNNMLAGMNMDSYRQFMRVNMKYHDAVVKAADDVIDVHRYALDVVKKEFPDKAELIEELWGRGAGLLRQGQSNEYLFVTEASSRFGSRANARYNPLSRRGPTARLGRKSAESIERTLRGSLAWDTLVNGGSLDEAFDRVYKYHFDYSDLSDFEAGVVRRVIPFYTWTRRNLPLQITGTFQNPKAVQKYNALRRNFDFTSDEDSNMPRWMYGPFSMGTPFTNSAGSRFFTTPDVPVADAFDILDEPQQLLGMVNPIIRAPAESFMGRQWSNGWAVEGEEPLPDALSFLAGPLKAAGIVEEGADGQLMVDTAWAHTARQWFPQIGRANKFAAGLPADDQVGFWEAYGSMFFGIGGAYNTPKRQASDTRGEAFDRIADMEHLEDLGYQRDDPEYAALEAERDALFEQVELIEQRGY